MIPGLGMARRLAAGMLGSIATVERDGPDGSEVVHEDLACKVVPNPRARAIDANEAAAVELHDTLVLFRVGSDVVAGDRITVGSRTYVAGDEDRDRTHAAYLAVQASRQVSAVETTWLELQRYDRDTDSWEELVPQPFQVIWAARQPVVGQGDGARSRRVPGTLIGPEGADIRVGDTFAIEGGTARVTEARAASGGRRESAFEASLGGGA